MIALLFVSAIMLFSSCKQEKKEVATIVYDPETVPTINEDSVTTLISDSGIIRYKLVAKTWQIFEQSKDPCWFFPDGFYVEQFDSLLHVEASVKSDTAWRYTKRNIWRLKGNVFIRNIRNETFSSQELFWDEKNQKVYSNVYIEINRPERLLLKGMGFEANQNFTQYVIKKPVNSDFYYDDTQQ